MRIVKPGGYLIFLATPNTQSVLLLFGELPAFDLPRNWFQVSDRTFETIIQNLNFEVTFTLYPYWARFTRA